MSGEREQQHGKALAILRQRVDESLQGVKGERWLSAHHLVPTVQDPSYSLPKGLMPMSERRSVAGEDSQQAARQDETNERHTWVLMQKMHCAPSQITALPLNVDLHSLPVRRAPRRVGRTIRGQQTSSELGG